MKYSSMNDEEIFAACTKIAELLRTEAKFIEEATAGNVLPRDPTARKQLIESHRKMIEQLEKDSNEMYNEFLRP
jgi:hypothetical protein